MRLPNLKEAFSDDSEMVTSEGSGHLKLHDLGKLVLPTGKIVACDPFVFPETEPFAVKVPPGQYTVTVSVARFQNQDQRVAYAALHLSHSPAMRWEMALQLEQDGSTLEGDQFFGYGVDSGTGCFMDANVARLLAERMTHDDDWDAKLIERMEETYVHTWDWLNISIDQSTGANLIAFHSGWGDGAYPSYWGYSDDGALAALVTDFCL